MTEERTSKPESIAQAQPTRRSFLRRFAAGAGAAAAAGTALATTAAKGDAMFGAEPFIGEITLFAGTFAPRGWAFCDGSTLAITDYQALFSILGTNYGGDGRHNFKIPDLKKLERTMGGARYIIALTGVFPPRS